MKPGDLVRHKRGGLYRIHERVVSAEALQKDQVIYLMFGHENVAVLVTDPVEAGAACVIYRSMEDHRTFLRPADVFDSLGRFTPLTGRKGYRGENCNRGACQRPGAVWWNTSTRSWYCQACAEKINYWSQKDDKTTLCFLMPEEFAP